MQKNSNTISLIEYTERKNLSIRKLKLDDYLSYKRNIKEYIEIKKPEFNIEPGLKLLNQDERDKYKSVKTEVLLYKRLM